MRRGLGEGGEGGEGPSFQLLSHPAGTRFTILPGWPQSGHLPPCYPPATYRLPPTFSGTPGFRVDNYQGGPRQGSFDDSFFGPDALHPHGNSGHRCGWGGEGGLHTPMEILVTKCRWQGTGRVGGHGYVLEGLGGRKPGDKGEEKRLRASQNFFSHVGRVQGGGEIRV